MSVKLKKRPAAGVVSPPPSHVAFFVDENGNPALKDSNGVVTPATNAGGPLTLAVQGSPPASEASKIKVYSKLVNGEAEIFAVDDQGRDVRLTTNGSPSLYQNFRWNGSPGFVWDATQVDTTLADVDVVLIDEASVLSGLASQEGQTINNGDRVLRACALSVTEDQVANGIYIASAGAWTRAPDADTGAEIQDAIVEWANPDNGIGAPPSIVPYFRIALWNPSGIPLNVGTDPQHWVFVYLEGFQTNNSANVVATSPIVLSGSQTIDDILLTGGENVLVTGQVDPVDNGLYQVVDPGPWERANEFTTGAFIRNAVVNIDFGTIYAGSQWYLGNSTNRNVVIGVDPQFWIRLGAADLSGWGPIRIDANFGDLVPIISISPTVTSGVVVLTLPEITPNSAGCQINILLYSTKKKSSKGGQVSFVVHPFGTDVVDDFNPGQTVGYTSLSGNTPLMIPGRGITFISDGAGRWSSLSSGMFPYPFEEILSELTPLPAPPPPA